jgi:replicative DNA helicase
MSDRIEPPRPFANVRAEEAVIGKIIGSAESYWAVADHLSAEHFTRPHHRDIFAAVARCCQEGPGPSLSLLEARLPQRWDGMEGDAAAWLVILQEKASDVSSAQDFVDDILTAWRERERVEIGRIASDPRKTFEQQKEAVEARFKAIEDIDRSRQAITLSSAVNVAVERAAFAYQNKGKRAIGISTGIAEIDKAIGPMTPGTVLTIGARSGHGKSALVAQILRNNAMPSLDASRINPSGFISMEMSEIQNGNRNLSSMSGISVGKIIKGDFTEKEFDSFIAAQRQLEQMPIYVQARGRMTARQVGNECRAMARRHGARLFAIDHLRLYEPEHEHWTEIRTIEHATKFNKDLAKELDAVIIQLAQLTREDQKTGNWRFKDTAIYGGDMVKANSDILVGVALPIEWLRQNQPEPPSDANPKGREAFDQWLKDMETWRDKAEFTAFKVRDGISRQWKELDFNGARMMFGDADREAVPF